jgi:hypothetical protein
MQRVCARTHIRRRDPLARRRRGVFLSSGCAPILHTRARRGRPPSGSSSSFARDSGYEFAPWAARPLSSGPVVQGPPFPSARRAATGNQYQTASASSGRRSGTPASGPSLPSLERTLIKSRRTPRRWSIKNEKAARLRRPHVLVIVRCFSTRPGSCGDAARAGSIRHTRV